MRVTPTRTKTRSDAQPPAWAYTTAFEDVIFSGGYRSLASCPEVVSAVDRIAQLGGLMTIHLMQNTKDGDTRVKDALARKIDVAPYSGGTRMTFVQWIISTMLLAGNGNAFVLPVTSSGYLDDLLPLPAGQVTTTPSGSSYVVQFNGTAFAPDEILHFRLKPDLVYPWRGTGYQVQLATVMDTLSQAAATRKSFMSSKWKPSVIVRVESMADEFSDPKKRAKLLNEYISTEEAGQPWLIPADLMQVQQVKPLSLNDLAINDSVRLDKQTVASLLGVPAFILGVGTYSQAEYNNFINSTLMPIMTGIQQELTKKLLTSSERYFRFNPRSLYAYSLVDLANVARAYRQAGLMTGNEARDWLGLAPLKGLNELVMLENYIPAEKAGDQKKLLQGSDAQKEDDSNAGQE